MTSIVSATPLALVDSFSSFWEAAVAFGRAIGTVGLLSLAIALSFHLTGLLLRSVAWRNIIAAGTGDAHTPLAPVAGGLLAGVGLNGIVPARGGDALKLFLIHRHLPRASYPMLTASLAPETLFNSVMGGSLLLWAWQTGQLPRAPELPGMPAFELSWAAEHPGTALGVFLVFVAAVATLAMSQRHRLARRWHQVADGVRILRRPRRYLRHVVTYQAAAWLARVVAALFFLDAFAVESTVRNALLVVMIQAVGSLLPLTPGGIGPKQALTVVVFAGEATRTALLAFSVGMEAAIVTFQAVVALVCATKMLGGSRMRDALILAKQDRIAEAALEINPR